MLIKTALRLSLAATLFTASASAQDTVLFDIDQAGSQWVWSGTTSLGPLLGNPSNQFGMAGDQGVRITRGTQPLESIRMVAGGIAAVIPDISARIPNSFSFLPDLAVIDITNLTLQFTTPQFDSIDGSGNFHSDATTTALSGTLTITPLIGSQTVQDLTGLTGVPNPVDGVLLQSGSNMHFDATMNGSFNFADPATGISATLNLTGSFLADWACPVPVNYCNANVNSTGGTAGISATGSTRIQDGSFGLEGNGLPNGQFAYFLGSRTQAFIANPGGSQGNLCVSGDIGRFNAQVGQINSGIFGISVDLDNIPVSPAAAIQPGETWNFTCWYRDANPTPTSNFTNGLSVVFCP